MSSVSSSSSAPKTFGQAIDPIDLECSICKNTMDKVTTLVCGHSFGQPCIQRWLQDNSRIEKSCPICKASSIVLPSNEVVAKITARRDALQAACDAQPKEEQRCGRQPELAEEAPMFVEEDPEPIEPPRLVIRCGVTRFEVSLQHAFAVAVVAGASLAALMNREG